MEFEDFVEPEIAVTAAVTAALFSPRARKVMRKGLVYGMAGMLVAGDAITTFARNVSQGVQQAGEAAAHAAQERIREAETGPERSTEAETTTASRRKTATKTDAAKSTESAGGQPA